MILDRAALGFFGMVAILYAWRLHLNATGKEVLAVEMKPTDREVDVRRWRHDGAQGLGKTWWEGTAPDTESSYDFIQDLIDTREALK